MKAIYKDNGSERLSVGALKALLAGIPDDAQIVHMKAENTQRDGWYWTFEAEGAVAPRPPKPSHLTYPPGVRGVVADDRGLGEVRR